AAAGFVLLNVAIALGVMRRGPEELGLGPDGDPPRVRGAASGARGRHASRRQALRTWRFWSVSGCFALGLAAQVGVLTHLVALTAPILGVAGAGRAVSVTTGAALIGRLATGLVIDRLDRRLVTSVTLTIQMTGVALLASATSAAAVYGGCVLF